MGCITSSTVNHHEFVLLYGENLLQPALRHGDPVRVFIANICNNYMCGLNILHQLLQVEPRILLSWHSDLLKKELHAGQYFNFDPYNDNIFDMDDNVFNNVTYLLCGDCAQCVRLNACHVTATLLSRVHKYINVHNCPPKIKNVKDYLKFAKDLSYEDIYTGSTRRQLSGYHTRPNPSYK